MRHKVEPVLLVGVNNDFRVASGAELMSERLQALRQLREVIDLAVEDYPNGAVFVAEWLLTSFDVDYAEATVSEGNPSCRILPQSVRPAMRNGGIHRPQPLHIQRLLFV